MDVYRFKQRLQTILGKETEKYAAVDVIADAYEELEKLDIDPYEIARYLLDTSYALMVQAEHGTKLGEFCDYADRVHQNGKRFAQMRKYFS